MFRSFPKSFSNVLFYKSSQKRITAISAIIMYTCNFFKSLLLLTVILDIIQEFFCCCFFFFQVTSPEKDEDPTEVVTEVPGYDILIKKTIAKQKHNFFVKCSLAFLFVCALLAVVAIIVYFLIIKRWKRVFLTSTWLLDCLFLLFFSSI